MRTVLSSPESVSRARRLAATLLMWLGAWLLLLAVVSAGQTMTLGEASPDLGAGVESAAPVEPAATAEVTTTIPSLLPESPLPSGDQPPAVAAGRADQKPAFLEKPDFSPAANPSPLALATPLPVAPTRLVIPAIKLDAPIRPVGLEPVTVNGQTLMQWQVPDEFAAGWQEASAAPGQKGNTVLNGHHNINGQVFRYLVNLKPGDVILVYAGEQVFRYAVSERHILPEKGQPLSVRLKNAQWIEPTPDERLTLVTCWPYTSNTHRLIAVARPAPIEPGRDGQHQ